MAERNCGRFIACEQALRGDLAAGREKEEELAIASPEFEFHLQFPCGSPSTELSDFSQLAQRGNERECKQTLKNIVLQSGLSNLLLILFFFDSPPSL